MNGFLDFISSITKKETTHIKKYTNIKDINVPCQTNGQLYIYVMENAPQGNIKIGRSHDVKTRMQSLSGSNNGGNKISKVAISDVTYLYTLERIIHSKFKDARISGTEWFDKDQITFDEICEYIDVLFTSNQYQTCNQVRKGFITLHGCNYTQDDDNTKETITTETDKNISD